MGGVVLKSFYVEYQHKQSKGVRGYVVHAESIGAAEDVGLEQLENDEDSSDPNPNNWSVCRSWLIKVSSARSGYIS